MSWLQFIDGVVRSAAWPIAAVLLAVVLRSKVTALLGGPLRKLKFGPAEAEWDTAARQTEELAADVATDDHAASQTLPLRLLQAAKAVPAGAIAEATKEIEVALRTLLASNGIEGTKLALGRLSSLALRHALIDTATHSSIDGLSKLRNLAIHGERKVSFTQAVEFLVIADAVMYALTSATERAETTKAQARRPDSAGLQRSAG